jgi:dihydrofolate synthase / folylpolyglutamate synthase
MQLSTLSDWLRWIEQQHPAEMSLGLDRIRVVAKRLEIKPRCVLVTVAGTNGKGSVVAGLESIYCAAGFKVGAFTSPYLFLPNEQIRINKSSVTDYVLCEALAAVEHARKDVPLTSFEYFTLAAFFIFQSQSLDVWLLEVGLGGRLDAVNLLDAELAIITTIGLDHMHWLGSTRDQIGLEKAGIFRFKQKVVCGDIDPPKSLIKQAQALQTTFYQQGMTYYFKKNSTSWDWFSETARIKNLPLPTLALENMATVLMGIQLLQVSLSVSDEAVRQGLKQVNLPGRIEVRPDLVTHIYDVSHNPQAIIFLARYLSSLKKEGKVHAVFSMLSDKDMPTCILQIKPLIDAWYVAPLQCKRATSLSRLKLSFQQVHQAASFYETIPLAYQEAKRQAKTIDKIVIFGSFHTVAEVKQFTRG